MKHLGASCVIAILLAAAACKSEPQGTPAIAEAYVGPSSLGIRQDIAQQSPVITTVKHGERRDILQRRRRFVKVRTASLVEGWTDERMLLSPEEVASLRRLSEQSKPAQSKGVANSYETLNVHFFAFFHLQKAGRLPVWL